MAVKKILTLATEDFVINLANTIRAEIEGKEFDKLNTDDKTILGSINEVNDLLQIFTVPEYDVNAKMLYGVLDPAEVGELHSFRDINYDMLKQANFIETKPGIRELSLGYVKQGQFIIIAVPVIFDLIAVKDDGFGNEIEFDEVLEYMIYALIMGIIGARIYYILFNLEYYKNNVELLFTKTPRPGWNQHRHNLVDQISKETNTPFLDFNKNYIHK